MFGYYYLALSLTLAFVGIGFYMLGPKLAQWDESLTRQLKEIEATRARNSLELHESAVQAEDPRSTIQSAGFGDAGFLPSLRVATSTVQKNVDGTLRSSQRSSPGTGQRVHVYGSADGRAPVISSTLKSGLKARRLSSRLRRGIGTLAAGRLGSAPLRRVPARTLDSAR